MTRNTSGGMIRQHPARGLWEARYTGADGRRHSLYAKTRKDAQERLRAALTNADHGIQPVGSRTTMAEIATTADVYAHLTPAMLERTAARMDGVLTRRKRVAGV